MRSPYKGAPRHTFWRSAVVESQGAEWPELYKKKFDIGLDMPIATAGSCFAQHIAVNLRTRGFTVLDVEPKPKFLPEAEAKRYGYSLYSARHGNIYTVRQLLQLTKEALGLFSPAEPAWNKGERFFDSLRPSVEPEGLGSAAEVMAHRAFHLQRYAGLLRRAKLFVFTLGLTEAWVHRETGTVYPTAPGTIAGDYDPAIFEFVNFGFEDIRRDFLNYRKLILRRNKDARFLLTVSPVPLAATATEKNVLVATSYSKSVLRSVAGSLSDEFADIDYFPSYEIITTPFSRRFFYEEDMREVRKAGVDLVMKTFFDEHGGTLDEPKPPQATTEGSVRRSARTAAENVVCEEAFLEAFAP